VFRYLASAPVLFAVFLCALPVAAQADAESAGDVRTVADDAPGENYLNLRAGGSASANNGRPVLCGEVTLWSRLSVEACGTGSGVLHQDDDTQIAHFRTKWRVTRWRLSGSSLQLHVAGGFAELQVGTDEPGFSFGRPTEANPVETAGPEAAASLRWQHPWAYGFEFLIDANLGAAWFEHAPRLLVPSSRLQPFGELTIGFGY
jgi:hypothetical protein